MTRAEHVKWCKVRANQEFDYYFKYEGLFSAIRNGLTSMMSDLGKHPETAGTLQTLCLAMMANISTKEDFRKFISEFNE